MRLELVMPIKLVEAMLCLVAEDETREDFVRSLRLEIQFPDKYGSECDGVMVASTGYVMGVHRIGDIVKTINGVKTRETRIADLRVKGASFNLSRGFLEYAILNAKGARLRELAIAVDEAEDGAAAATSASGIRLIEECPKGAMPWRSVVKPMAEFVPAKGLVLGSSVMRCIASFASKVDVGSGTRAVTFCSYPTTDTDKPPIAFLVEGARDFFGLVMPMLHSVAYRQLPPWAKELCM